jgi:hypothetical protein
VLYYGKVIDEEPSRKDRQWTKDMRRRNQEFRSEHCINL